MDKKSALKYLSKLEKQGIVLGLSRVRKFLSLLGNPEKEFRSVHIAGTNGKGSTAALLAAILREAGYNAGLYTSPHLIEFNERIQVNGKKIPDRDLVRLVEELKREKEKNSLKLTYFEFTTALAFKYFAEKGVDFAVVEVGMGGRLDATNVISPIATAITNISLDHEPYLGKTIKKIAAEKAGIIKQGIPLLTTERNITALEVFRKACQQKNSELIQVNAPYPGKISLNGEFQKMNAALAVAIAQGLENNGFDVSQKAIESGLESTKWPGRFEIVSQVPLVVLDCAHNVGGIRALHIALHKSFPYQQFILVFGASSDKNVKKMLREIAPAASEIIATSAKIRATPTKKLVAIAKSLGKPCEEIPDVKNAVKAAIKKAGKQGKVLVCGSCFVVGEAKPLFSG